LDDDSGLLLGIGGIYSVMTSIPEWRITLLLSVSIETGTPFENDSNAMAGRRGWARRARRFDSLSCEFNNKKPPHLKMIQMRWLAGGWARRARRFDSLSCEFNNKKPPHLKMIQMRWLARWARRARRFDSLSCEFNNKTPAQCIAK